MVPKQIALTLGVSLATVRKHLRLAKHKTGAQTLVELAAMAAQGERTARPSAAAEPTAQLSARQLQVIALLAEGQRYRDIAAVLAISERQARRDMADARQLSGVRSSAQLVALAGAGKQFPSEAWPPPRGGARAVLPASTEPQLTARELDVLRLLADGFSDKDIGGRLFITYTTVRVHVRHVHAKLGTHTRTAALNAARRRGLIEDDRPPRTR